MSNILDGRPYAGTWSQDILNEHRTITTWTPDAIVLFNGDTKVAGCNECKNKIDFMGFITSVQVSAGVNAGDLTCSIEMSIPGHYGDSIFKDGEFILSLGIEVNVYYRGFFEIDGLDPKDTTYTSEIGEEFELNKVKMRPYYPMFHGVTVSSSYNFSGGFYSLSLSCNSLLHFWANQKVVTNAAYLASRPEESRGSVRTDGHVYTNMTPFQIIYDLYRDSAGSADGLEWVFSSSSNQNAKVETGESMFSLALKYWETRFSKGLYGLRMYGASGSLYTQTQTAYLGDPSRGSNSKQINKIINDGVLNPAARGKTTTNAVNKAWVLGLIDKDSTLKHARLTPDLLNLVELDDSGKQGSGMLVTEQKAYITDIGAIGSIELFSTQYESKQSIAETVAEKVGFEFYQDVDGDLVFKPPFYNLNVKGNRVYTVKREDVVDISFELQEPEFTYAVCKGGMFRNTAGLGMEGTWGVKGTYVDYRLVAKYGWKPLEFDTTFFNTARSAFFAAVVDLERKNVNVNGCSLTIPMRPELKPGYPVYIEYIDCFYYVNSVQHSFSFGGDCTTSLTLTARRKKFLPPGDPNKQGIESIDLGNPLLPPKSLITEVEPGLYKTVGFPNVVMALDPTTISPYVLQYGIEQQGGIVEPKNSNDRKAFRNGLIQQAQILGVLKLHSTARGDFLEGPWELTVDGQKKLLKKRGGLLESEQALSSIVQEVKKERARVATLRRRGRVNASEESKKVEANYRDSLAKLRSASNAKEATIADLVQAITAQASLKDGGQTETVSLLDALSNKRASFNPNLPGTYRYYSSSHPEPEHQAPPGNKQPDSSDPTNIDAGEYAKLEDQIVDATTNTVLKTKTGNVVEFETRENYTGLRGIITRTKRTRKKAEPVPTKDILHLSFQQHGSAKTRIPKVTSYDKVTLTNKALISLAQKTFVSRLTAILKKFKGDTDASKINSAFFSKKRAKVTSNLKNFTSLKKGEADISGTIPPSDHPTIIKDSGAAFLTSLSSAFPALMESADAQNLKASPSSIQQVEKDVRYLIGSGLRVKGRTQRDGNPITTFVDGFKSPILPVSDEEGYEVFGSYQYGRGLDLAKGGSYDQLLRQDPTRILTESEIDQFLSLLNKKGGSTPEELSAQVAKIVAQRIGGNFVDGRYENESKLADAYFRLTGEQWDGRSEEKKAASLQSLGNAIMTTTPKDQVVENIPIRLSDIRPTTGANDTSCECRGDTSDIEMYLLELGVTDRLGLDVTDNEIVNVAKQAGVDSKVSEWDRRQKRVQGVPADELPSPQEVSAIKINSVYTPPPPAAAITQPEQPNPTVPVVAQPQATSAPFSDGRSNAERQRELDEEARQQVRDNPELTVASVKDPGGDIPDWLSEEIPEEE